MKRTRIIIPAVFILLAISVTAFAASYTDSADRISNLTGDISRDEIISRRQAGTRYCDIARELGVGDQFIEERLEEIDALVEDRMLAKEEGDAVKEQMGNSNDSLRYGWCGLGRVNRRGRMGHGGMYRRGHGPYYDN